MSKRVAYIPMESIDRIQVYINQGRKTLTQIKAETGADHLINGGLYQGSKAVCHLKADGAVYAQDGYCYWGYAWDAGPDIAMRLVPAPDKRSYICCVELVRSGAKVDKLIYNREQGGRRGRTAMGLREGKLCLYVSKDGSADAKTPEALRDELAALGWDSAVMLDCGGSSQCDFAGQTITSARKVHNLILVYLKKDTGQEPEKEGKPMGTKKVCLDPGHGVESPGKCSPDGSYYEHEFALDLGRRVRVHLERCGADVVMTRTDEHCPTGRADTNDLNHRVKVSDEAGADLFVSLHSNAQGGMVWGTVQGYGIYTSAGPETAARNVCARKLLARAKEAGVTIWGGGLFHDLSLVVTRKTKAPAVLIEHGFHTSREETERLKSSAYRDKLAEIDAKGILDYLGVAWVPEVPEDKPWYADHQAWVQEMGIADGTRPNDVCTRAEVWTMLHRLYNSAKL